MVNGELSGMALEESDQRLLDWAQVATGQYIGSLNPDDYNQLIADMAAETFEYLTARYSQPSG